MENKTKYLYMDGYLLAEMCENSRDFNKFRNSLEEYTQDNPLVARDKDFAINLARRTVIGKLLKKAKNITENYLRCLDECASLESETDKLKYAESSELLGYPTKFDKHLRCLQDYAWDLYHLEREACGLASEIGEKPYHTSDYFLEHLDEFYASQEALNKIEKFFYNLGEKILKKDSTNIFSKYKQECLR